MLQRFLNRNFRKCHHMTVQSVSICKSTIFHFFQKFDLRDDGIVYYFLRFTQKYLFGRGTAMKQDALGKSNSSTLFALYMYGSKFFLL